MPLPLPLPRPRSPITLLAAARHWPVSSQTHARRNAMVALTSLAQRRAEREDVDAYLADAPPRRADAPELPLPRPRRSTGS